MSLAYVELKQRQSIWNVNLASELGYVAQSVCCPNLLHDSCSLSYDPLWIFPQLCFFALWLEYLSFVSVDSSVVLCGCNQQLSKCVN